MRLHRPVENETGGGKLKAAAHCARASPGDTTYIPAIVQITSHFSLTTNLGEFEERSATRVPGSDFQVSGPEGRSCDCPHPTRPAKASLDETR